MMLNSKICTKCGVEKLLEEFSKSKDGKFGRRAQCRVCVAEYHQKNKVRRNARQREHYQKNKEKYAARTREYEEKNKDKIAARKREYWQANKEKLSPRKREYRENNKEKLAEYYHEYRQKNKAKISVRRREHYQKNRERCNEQSREYHRNNRDKMNAQKREYRQNNKDICAARSAKRRAAKICRTPAWADLETIKLFYEARQAISEATGKEYHVDHMIPLQGKTVSGLHVPGNLQIIPAERNISKRNTF